VSVLDRSVPPDDHQDAIQEGLTPRCIDADGIEVVMIDGFSAGS
jgi:hypothetical protein